MSFLPRPDVPDRVSSLLPPFLSSLLALQAILDAAPDVVAPLARSFVTLHAALRVELDQMDDTVLLYDELTETLRRADIAAAAHERCRRAGLVAADLHSAASLPLQVIAMLASRHISPETLRDVYLLLAADVSIGRRRDASVYERTGHPILDARAQRHHAERLLTLLHAARPPLSAMDDIDLTIPSAEQPRVFTPRMRPVDLLDPLAGRASNAVPAGWYPRVRPMPPAVSVLALPSSLVGPIRSPSPPSLSSPLP